MHPRKSYKSIDNTLRESPCAAVEYQCQCLCDDARKHEGPSQASVEMEKVYAGSRDKELSCVLAR